MYSKSIDIALLLLRVTFGGLMLLNHGWGKLMKIFADGPIKFADPIGLGEEFSLYLTVFAEFFCAFLVVIGLFTRQALIPLIITMLVAIFVIHIGDPFKDMETAIIYLVPYVCLFLTGPGFYSFDNKRAI